MSAVPTVSIKLQPQSVEIILNVLNQVPRGQINDLWNDIANQYQAQMLAPAAEVAEAKAEAAKAD